MLSINGPQSSGIIAQSSVLLCPAMIRRTLALAAMAFALAACHRTDRPDTSAEWQRVLQSRKIAESPHATPRDRQVYADRVAAFVQHHPSHGRAQHVYHHLQLEFGEDLAALGKYQDAIRFYRAELAADPPKARADHDIQAALDRLTVSRGKLLKLEKGMSQHEVAQILGTPIPGWTTSNRHRDSVMEAWYYRMVGGAVAGVYFRDGELIAAEENSTAKLAPLMR